MYFCTRPAGQLSWKNGVIKSWHHVHEWLKDKVWFNLADWAPATGFFFRYPRIKTLNMSVNRGWATELAHSRPWIGLARWRCDNLSKSKHAYFIYYFLFFWKYEQYILIFNYFKLMDNCFCWIVKVSKFLNSMVIN